MLELAAMNAIAAILVDAPYPIRVLSVPFDWLMLTYVIVTAIAAAAAITSLVTIRSQLKVMQHQLDQMKSSGTQTDDLIATTRDQANALAVVADAAKKSADAALLSANALVNSERPWLFERFTITNTNVPIPGGSFFVPTGIKLDLINLGRTPAEVFFAAASFSIQPHQEVHSFDTTGFFDASAEFVHRRILAPEETWENFHYYTPSSPDANLRGMSDTHSLILFGIVKYRDTLGGEATMVRETRYFYVYEPGNRMLRMAGPPGANRHI